MYRKMYVSKLDANVAYLMKTYTYRRNPEDNSKLADTDVVQSIVDASKKAVETYNEIQKLSILEQDLRTLYESQNNAGGLKGFIMESLDIAVKNHTKHRALVIDDNGFADLILKNSENADPISCVYKPGKINFAELKEAGIERFLLNNNHPNFNVLVEEAKQYGINLEPTKRFAAECQMIADGMKLEYKITGNPISFFVPHAYTTSQAFNLIAQRGVAAAGAAAKFGGALAVGVAVASVLSGDKTIREAAEDAFVNVTDAAFYGDGRKYDYVYSVRTRRCDLIDKCSRRYCCQSCLWTNCDCGYRCNNIDEKENFFSHKVLCGIDGKWHDAKHICKYYK